ncbi:MAG: ribosome-associated protein [Psychrosphaera sp.]|jgi:ribosome-associated protein
MTKSYYLLPDDENYVSKAELKKEVKELQAFAEQLVNLGKSQKKRLSASDELQAAFILADKISNKPDALRRHMQFITKQLKDEDLDKLRAEYERIMSPNLASDKVMKKLEKTREKLLKNGDSAINELIDLHPSLERQKLRQLVRQAKKEVEKEQPGKNYKELFQYIKTETGN